MLALAIDRRGGLGGGFQKLKHLLALLLLNVFALRHEGHVNGLTEPCALKFQSHLGNAVHNHTSPAAKPEPPFLILSAFPGETLIFFEKIIRPGCPEVYAK